jgi:D-alanyl-D-alanine carboxypeptidase/D-alanyl-D-alanine-endopeptidase (penicillin-binding protein 4)
LKLVQRRCADWEDGWTLPVVEQASAGELRVRLRGDFPLDCTASTAINVIDRVALADRMFRALWKRMGGTFRGKTVEGRAQAGARLVASHSSRTLAEITRDVNKRSDNPITRMVFLTLGALSAQGPEEPTARRADREVREWLSRHGIDPTGIVLENGSGLSRTERISPRQLAAVLRAGAMSEWAPEFLASLPIVATDGGMRTRLKDIGPYSRGRVKTGTLRDVTAVAGYIQDPAGETYVVVAVVNDPLAVKAVARPIVDAVLEWVARPPRALAGNPP